LDYLTVDGTYGEGGGQILRLALAFSVIERKPVRVTGIRAGRKEPGLKRQHLSAVRVMGEAFGAKVDGGFEGSTEVSFAPGTPRAGALRVDMGTAASIPLVLQALVPAAALSETRLSVELVGGTDVPWSPTFDYLTNVARPAFEAVGIRFEATAARRGYYPRGGGRVSATIEPTKAVIPLDLSGAPRVLEPQVTSRCAGLPPHVAERQAASARAVLEAEGIKVGTVTRTVEEADSPGSSLLVSQVGQGTFLGADGLGAKGRPAEEVGRDAASRFAKAGRGGSVDPNLADMVVPFLTLAEGRSVLRVGEATAHLQTGVWLARKFTGREVQVTRQGDGYLVVVPR
jgi:RNA 3'-phosphate cyclase